MDISGLCRRIAEVRSAKADAEHAHGLEDSLYRDVVKAIANGQIKDPVGFCIIALETQNIEFDRRLG